MVERLVFTSEDGRILFSYREWNHLSEEYRNRGVIVDDAALTDVPPAPAGKRAVPTVEDGSVVWRFEDDPEAINENLPGEHFVMEP